MKSTPACLVAIMCTYASPVVAETPFERASRMAEDYRLVRQVASEVFADHINENMGIVGLASILQACGKSDLSNAVKEKTTDRHFEAGIMRAVSQYPSLENPSESIFLNIQLAVDSLRAGYGLGVERAARAAFINPETKEEICDHFAVEADKILE